MFYKSWIFQDFSFAKILKKSIVLLDSMKERVMSTWVDCKPTTKELEDILRQEIKEVQTLEEWLQMIQKISGDRSNYSEFLDLWREKGLKIKRDLISKIETPEDGFALYFRFRALGTYNRDIQEELGDKIREVVVSWRPRGPGGCIHYF